MQEKGFASFFLFKEGKRFPSLIVTSVRTTATIGLTDIHWPIENRYKYGKFPMVSIIDHGYPRWNLASGRIRPLPGLSLTSPPVVQGYLYTGMAYRYWDPISLFPIGHVQ